MERSIPRSQILAQKGLLDVGAGAGLVALGIANIPLFLTASPRLEGIMATTENPIVGLAATLAVLADGGFSLFVPFMGAVIMAKGSTLLALAGGYKIVETAARFRGNIRTRRTPVAGLAIA